jgi:hypothetical protein
MRLALSLIVCFVTISGFNIGMAMGHLGVDLRAPWGFVLAVSLVSVVVGLAFHTYLLRRNDASRT